ncbi:hypothetical protein A3C57_00630 [Candidatus Nomurabacteria bacterium RIFCSPHIGHO2_02_FULL_33_12]|uniref:NYN domain-containing protein n=1 Tax=Candidatus Nomurabacteria bacterium RIFCSPLOWO2_01_FULL_33_17 TaxID=1801764 RepID=A0A1F6WQB6_9BACT|nr:MAG: hypothetical protein A3C57_00630 [Candidatus Nomurabacteria bacterium RIFCSPHIGHO2_02_FULL_33_12]OGI84079.1 MAG: hypothetical protein A2903_02360 [Candidatus Nomurabacteria bacterium RIFCSPLOWO2_01_FULL_33_17]
MKVKVNNYAFIDAQNVHLGILELGWKIDWKKFRIWLKDKFGVEKALVFIGYHPGNESLYSFLQHAGFVCIFKPTLEYKDGTIKGNCDAELVLHASAIEFDNYEKAIIVSGDGDFTCLIEFLQQKDKLKMLVVPNEHKYSALLKRFNSSERKFILFLNRERSKIEYIDLNKKGA